MSSSDPFNLAEWICRKHKDAVTRVAIKERKPAGFNTYTYGALDYLSDKFASVLSNSGIKHGDVVAIILPMSAAFTVAHFGALKCGAIIYPDCPPKDEVLLRKKLQASKAKAAVIEKSFFASFPRIQISLDTIESSFIVDDYVSRDDFEGGIKSFWYEINFAVADFQVVTTESRSPAYLFLNTEAAGEYTSLIATHAEFLSNDNLVAEAVTSDSEAVLWEEDRSDVTPANLKIIYALLIRGSAIEVG